ARRGARLTRWTFALIPPQCQMSSKPPKKRRLDQNRPTVRHPLQPLARRARNPGNLGDAIASPTHDGPDLFRTRRRPSSARKGSAWPLKSTKETLHAERIPDDHGHPQWHLLKDADPRRHHPVTGYALDHSQPPRCRPH